MFGDYPFKISTTSPNVLIMYMQNLVVCSEQSFFISCISRKAPHGFSAWILDIFVNSVFGSFNKFDLFITFVMHDAMSCYAGKCYKGTNSLYMFNIVLCSLGLGHSHLRRTMITYLSQLISALEKFGRHFEDDISRCIFVNEKFCILIKISLKYVPKGPIDNISS